MKGMTNNVRYSMFKIDRLNDKIDRDRRNGKSNESDNRVANHLTAVAADGARIWQF